MSPRKINWDDPSERAQLIEEIGPDAYNRALQEHKAQSVIETVAGHQLRRVGSAFGPLIAVGDTGRAFKSIEAAREYALNTTPPAPVTGR